VKKWPKARQMKALVQMRIDYLRGMRQALLPGCGTRTRATSTSSLKDSAPQAYLPISENFTRRCWDYSILISSYRGMMHITVPFNLKP
jgi:hypothetical protein